MRDCLTRYAATGWTGRVPAACRNRQLHLPQRYGRWLWGWPHLFVRRMRAVDTRVLLVRDGGAFSDGFDTPAELAGVPAGWTGGVWSNAADVVAPRLPR